MSKGMTFKDIDMAEQARIIDKMKEIGRNIVKVGMVQ